MNPSSDKVRNYQRDKLGRNGGETALIEMRGFPSKGVQPQAYEEDYTKHRTQIIRERIIAHEREFVLYYSSSAACINVWEAIAGAKLALHEPLTIGSTVHLVTHHPNARMCLKKNARDCYPNSKEYWAEMANRIKAEMAKNRAKDPDIMHR